MFFQRKTRAMDYDCDANNRLRLSAAMRYMQQTSEEHMESLELSYQKMLSENMVFLMSKACLKVHEMPLAGEPLAVGTAPVTGKGVQFIREFRIDSAQGKPLVSALTLWVLVDPQSRRIMRPKSFPYALPLQDTILEGALQEISLPKQQGPGSQTKVLISYSHIDSNHHVNNSMYADFICDVLPYDRLLQQGVDTMTLAFEKEARWGDELNIVTEQLDQDSFLVVGSHPAATCFKGMVTLKNNALHNH